MIEMSEINKDLEQYIQYSLLLVTEMESGIRSGKWLRSICLRGCRRDRNIIIGYNA